MKTEREFPAEVFSTTEPAVLRQGDWTSDATFLLALKHSWCSQYADYIGDTHAVAYVEQLHREERLYAHHEPLILHAWVDERIVGITALRPLGKIDLITMLEVLPAYRGMGIGKQLVQGLSLASERTMAHVSIHRPRVLAFYEQLGFHVLNRAHERHGKYLLEFDVVAKNSLASIRKP